MEENTKYLHDKLNPHFGFFKTLNKFVETNEISSKEEIDFILHKVNNKELIKSLPKSIFKYSSYIKLIMDISDTEKKVGIIRFIKENVYSNSKEFFLNVLDENFDQVEQIVNSSTKLPIFLRWSSRIKSNKQAVEYIQGIISSEQQQDFLFRLADSGNEVNGYNVVEMTNYNEIFPALPASWCIRNVETFNQYRQSVNMYLVSQGREIYGVNVPINGSGMISVIDRNNQGIDRGDKYSEIMEIFRPSGRDKIESTKTIGEYIIKYTQRLLK